MVIALCSAKGAPGVTTSALALALSWPRPVVLAELDPAGGDVLAGYGRGQLAAGGLADLELAARRGGVTERLDEHLLHLDTGGRARLLPGLTDPVSARRVEWARLATALAALPGRGIDVLADCGRLGAASFPADVVAEADCTLLVTGSGLRAVHAARHAVSALQEASGGRPGAVAVLLVGPGEPYGAAEIADAVGAPVAAVLPRDARAAAVLSDGAPPARLFAQSALMRAARTAAAGLAGDRPAAAGSRRAAAVPVAPPPLVGSDRVG